MRNTQWMGPNSEKNPKMSVSLLMFLALSVCDYTETIMVKKRSEKLIYVNTKCCLLMSGFQGI